MSLSNRTTKLQKYISTHNNFFNIQENKITKTYQDLIDCITEHNHRYYIENSSIISDTEYDQLFNFLKKIEEYFPHIISANSPTQNLVGQISDHFQQANHKTKLLSLENTYNEQDIIDRDIRTRKELTKDQDEPPIDNNLSISYYIEPKFDWLWVELIYNWGELQQAITRGDGETGEDISTNIKMISSIPQKLNLSKHPQLKTSTFSVKWEILMSKPSRERLNKIRETNGENPFANTRNAAAWSIKLLDSNEVKKRSLNCFVYDLVFSQNPNLFGTTQKTILNTFKDIWLPIFQRKQESNNIQEVIKLCSTETHNTLKQYPYDFDGLVIKISNTTSRKKIWQTEHHPKRAIAYKFPAEQISTQVNSVDFQIWRTGVITPVANLEPVKLSWVTISRVSLHNFDFINDKDIHLHDFVRIQRSWEVIPYIMATIPARREQTQIQKINPPIHCPSCGEAIINKEWHYYCPNHKCPAIIKEQIKHFVSKNCMDIEWLGDSIIELLVDQKILSNFADLYKIPEPHTKLTIKSLPWIWNKKTFEIIQQLKKSKNKELRRLLNALWIPGIWKKMAQELEKHLAQKYIDLNISQNQDYLKLITQQFKSEEYLESIHGIGKKTIQSIIVYFTQNQELLAKLQQIGINLTPINSQKTNNWKLQDQHFSLTGSFPISRGQLIEAFEEQGAIFDHSPNKKTDFILIWEKPGGKLKKAEELDIQIIASRETISNQFTFLKNIKTSITKEKKEIPTMQSLF